MGKLTDTPINRAIKRAFPQTNWPETAAIDLLEKYDDGAWIKRDGLSQSDLNIMVDLATSGIIESNRKPKFVMGQFAGFENSFRYKADLEYLEESEPEKNGVWHWIVLGVSIGVSISSIVLSNAIQRL
jgi:hypothetical protein